MTLSDYCYKNGMTLEEYEAYERHIISETERILNKAKELHPKVDGLFYPTNEIITGKRDDMETLFIIHYLKKSGHMEFYDNNNDYRVV